MVRTTQHTTHSPNKKNAINICIKCRCRAVTNIRCTTTDDRPQIIRISSDYTFKIGTFCQQCHLHLTMGKKWFIIVFFFHTIASALAKLDRPTFNEGYWTFKYSEWFQIYSKQHWNLRVSWGKNLTQRNSINAPTKAMQLQILWFDFTFILGRINRVIIFNSFHCE